MMAKLIVLKQAVEVVAGLIDALEVADDFGLSKPAATSWQSRL